MKKNTTEMPQKLAENAFLLFSEKGINQVNMDTIAAKAKVTKGSLYWHYRSKKEIIEAAAAHYYQGWYALINRIMAKQSDPLLRLEAIIEISVRSCLLDKKNRIFTLELITNALYERDIRRSWAQFYTGVREFYIGLVEQAKAAGKLKTKDSRVAIDLMLVAMEGYKQRSLFEPQICTKPEERAICGHLMAIIRQF